jgi:hypothetical protein
MKDNVALVYKLRRHRLVVNGINRVVKTRIILQVLNILYRAGRKVVYDEDL